MINLKELDDLVSFVKKKGCKDLTLLKCTTEYPSSANDSNILSIPFLKKRYKCKVGLSDHTLGIGASVAATAIICALSLPSGVLAMLATTPSAHAAAAFLPLLEINEATRDLL